MAEQAATRRTSIQPGRDRSLLRALDRGTKRAIDVVVSALGLIVLAPVLVCIALAALICQGKPVLYRSQRAGLSERPFELLKFRTMANTEGPDGALLPDAERVTTVGAWLRSRSLDELPQLWNVLLGEMSLIGPRPLPVAYLNRYSATEHRRHLVRPGITGLAQVNGRNLLGWEERLAMDVLYVDNRNFLLDVRIAIRTLAAVIRSEGISAQGHATMPELRPGISAEAQG